MPARPSAHSSIFVSHTNGDRLAERVLKRLLDTARPGTGGGLQLVYDRESIAPGETWRQRIFEWLEYCPAAVLLISPDSFLHEKPWVAREAFFLAVRRQVRGNVLIIPVVIGDAARRLETERAFEPSWTREIEAIACPDPDDAVALGKVVDRIRDALADVTAMQGSAADGLLKATADVLKFHRDAYPELAQALGPPGLPLTSEAIAGRLISEELDVRLIGDAVTAFAQYAASLPTGAGNTALARLCKLLCARKVPDGAARLLAIEMAKPPDAARAVLLDSTNDDVTELYVVRAAGRPHHQWLLLDPGIVLELGAIDSARQAFAAALSEKLAPRTRDPAKAIKDAAAAAWTLRRMGRPAVFQVDLADLADRTPLIAALRSVTPDCGLLLRAEHDLASAAGCPEDEVCRLEPPCDEKTERELVGLKLALDSIIQPRD